MGVTMQNESLQEMMEKVNISQEQVEKTAFDVLNEQDKLCCLVSETTTQVQTLVSKMEAIQYYVVNLLLKQQTVAEGEQAQELEKAIAMVEEQESIGVLISQAINSLACQASHTCELVHRMENEVAVHREDLEIVGDCISCGAR